MVIYNKITFYKYQKEQLDILDSLLKFLPFCNTSKKRDAILSEVRNIRNEISNIEEMCRSEKQRHVKWKVIKIDSDINNM